MDPIQIEYCLLDNSISRKSISLKHFPLIWFRRWCLWWCLCSPWTDWKWPLYLLGVQSNCSKIVDLHQIRCSPFFAFFGMKKISRKFRMCSTQGLHFNFDNTSDLDNNFCATFFSQFKTWELKHFPQNFGFWFEKFENVFYDSKIPLLCGRGSQHQKNLKKNGWLQKVFFTYKKVVQKLLFNA